MPKACLSSATLDQQVVGFAPTGDSVATGLPEVPAAETGRESERWSFSCWQAGARRGMAGAESVRHAQTVWVDAKVAGFLEPFGSKMMLAQAQGEFSCQGARGDFQVSFARPSFKTTSSDWPQYRPFRHLWSTSPRLTSCQREMCDPSNVRASTRWASCKTCLMRPWASGRCHQNLNSKTQLHPTPL